MILIALNNMKSSSAPMCAGHMCGYTECEERGLHRDILTNKCFKPITSQSRCEEYRPAHPYYSKDITSRSLTARRLRR